VLKINFNDLINNYDKNLLDNLRGFGKNEDYLKFWVPGTNNYQSFLNLIDALMESKIHEFKISLNNVNNEKNFLKNVKELLNDVSVYNKENNNENYVIKLDKLRYLDFKKKSKKVSDKGLEFKIDTTKIAKLEKNDENLIFSYRDTLKNYYPKSHYSEKIKKNENTHMSKFDEIKLYFEIEKNIIVNVFHDSSANTITEKLINTFFELIINKNIQEAADHGVIYLEETIRNQKKIKVSEGIILPRQGGEYFNILNNIIRNVFNEYKIKNNINFDINRNYFKISENWKNLSYKEKINKINKILFEIKDKYSVLTDKSILISKIENNFKINLDVDKNFSKLQSEKNILLEIETKLKTLDQTLEVFIGEILDQNKLRLKNSPQKIS
tara:strand:+ start:716 stop:1864 length:1149 start_codon:yes stop_codon:yes gene_type:complete